MKKKLVLQRLMKGILISTLILGMATGCGKVEEKPQESVKEALADVETIEETTEVIETEEEQEKTEEEDAEVVEEEGDVEKEPFVTDRSAVFELLSHMNVGWNLGNTFDAWGAGNSLRSETYWGNPKTTQEMIDALAEKGFNTIRIPVTWAEHVGSAPNYKIKEDWLDRVQEVVDYAMNQNMYIILDTHHEPDFWMTTKPEKLDEVKEELVAIWKQVAKRFANYDNHLIFEGMNENREKGSAAEWNGGTAEERVVINELNQAFVDAVRATGGNNEDRCLIISTYGNNPGYNAVKELAIPEDNNIAVAVHMYTPYVFTYEPSDGSIVNWDGSKKSDFVSTIKQLDKVFIQNDVPVIVTEFGAVNKNNEGEVVKWVEDYLGAMNKYGIKCVWWDNGNFSNSGEKFAIFDRRNLSWYVPKVVEALIDNSLTENRVDMHVQ